jgi:hypothetical protein
MVPIGLQRSCLSASVKLVRLRCSVAEGNATAHRAITTQRPASSFRYDGTQHHAGNSNLARIRLSVAANTRIRGSLHRGRASGSIRSVTWPAAHSRLRRSGARIVRRGIHRGANFGSTRSARKTFRRSALNRIFPAGGNSSWFCTGYLFPPRPAAGVDRMAAARAPDCCGGETTAESRP